MKSLQGSLIPNQDRLEMVLAKDSSGKIVGAALVAVYNNGTFARQIYEGAAQEIADRVTTADKLDKSDIEFALRKEVGKQHPVVIGEMMDTDFTDEKNAGKLSDAKIMNVEFPFKPWTYPEDDEGKSFPNVRQGEWRLVAQGDPAAIEAVLPESIAAHTWAFHGKQRDMGHHVAPGYGSYAEYRDAAKTGWIHLQDSALSHADKIANPAFPSLLKKATLSK